MNTRQCIWISVALAYKTVCHRDTKEHNVGTENIFQEICLRLDNTSPLSSLYHQEPATFLLYHHFGHVFLFRCVLGVSLWLGWGSICVAGCSFSLLHRYYPNPATLILPTHIETRTHDQSGDTIEKSQAPDDGCINIWNMLSASAGYTDSTPTQPHRYSNTHRNKNTRPKWWYNRKVAGSWWWMY